MHKVLCSIALNRTIKVSNCLAFCKWGAEVQNISGVKGDISVSNLHGNFLFVGKAK